MMGTQTIIALTDTPELFDDDFIVILLVKGKNGSLTIDPATTTP
jgi:hypothetical protein